MTKEWKWQPFVPEARVNAQVVTDTDSGAAIDTVFAAGVKTGERLKYGEVFAVHPGHSNFEMDHYIYSHVIVNEVEYDEIKPYWRYEILADKQGDNLLRVEFVKSKDRQMLVKLTAINQTRYDAEWVCSFLAGPNRYCRNVDLSENLIRINHDKFSMSFDHEWFSIPLISHDTPLLGMLLQWGKPCPADRKYMNFFRQWRIPAEKEQSCWAILGDIDPGCNPDCFKDAETRFESLAGQRTPAATFQPGDDMAGMIEHLSNQLKFNRVYPPSIKYAGRPMPVYTPAASWDAEFFWDAGFIAVGLAEISPEMSFSCISQYLPRENPTVFPNFIGSLSLIQVTAAWNLFQKTGDNEFLRKLYPGLHELFMYCSGQLAWPSGEHLDESGDGLLSPIGGGSGLDDSPSQIWTRGYGVEWSRQSGYWCIPFDVNPTKKLIRAASVNMTAFALLSAKLLKQICNVIDINTLEIYDEFIEKSENSLQKFSWNNTTGHYHWTIKDSKNQCPFYDISGLTPLFSASFQTEEQKDKLLDKLLNVYLTEYGLTTVDPDADFYRSGYWCGAVWMPFHWFFWKSLIGLGLLEDAEKIALNVLKNYARNHRDFPVCYEKFDLESGKGCGDFSFSGLSSIVLNLWAGYRRPGSVTTGFLVIPRKIKIAEKFDAATLELLSDEKTLHTGVILVLKPNTGFMIESKDYKFTVSSDQFGRIEFQIPNAKYIKLRIVENKEPVFQSA